jgi:hypothetical protein
MPITKLNTYESVPIGKNNFDDYLFYLRELTSRANPFVGVSADDVNTIIPLGSGVSVDASGIGIASSSDSPYILSSLNWNPDSQYLIEYRVSSVNFENTTTNTSNVLVYFGDDSLLGSTDINFLPFSQIDFTELNPGTDSKESLVFSPSASDSSSLIFYIPEQLVGSITANVTVVVYELNEKSLITLTGQSSGSYVFIVNDNNELFALPTSFLTSDYATPGISTWQLPLSFISKVSLSPGQTNFVYETENLPFSFNKIDPSDYILAKNDSTYGSYEKGFVLHTVNGVPQIGESGYFQDSFFNVDLLTSDELLELKSLRLGSEYPKPVYTNSINHQYADEVIWGFSDINSSNLSSDALGGIEFQNKLNFPYTDFTLEATLLLVHKKISGVETYYYIPRDVTSSPLESVKENHYRVIDQSSGLVEFNFNLNLSPSVGDKFLIVSAEQLSQVITGNVTEYFSSYGKLYSPTANTSFSTKILSFDSSLLLVESFETELPELNVIPSTKILGSGGGPILADSEGEFDTLTIYAFSYPGRIDADEFVRLQVNSYEPDIIDFYYFCGTSANDFVKTSIPYPVYIKILDNKISWYNRGINFLTYDLVSRADFTSLCLTAKVNVRPPDSAKLSETRRRGAFSSIAGIIAPNQTTFVSPSVFFANSFLVNNSEPRISSVSSPNGSLLVGNGTLTPPSPLSVGQPNDVLTVRSGYPTWASDVILSSVTSTSINGVNITSGVNTFTITRGTSSLIRSGAHALTLTTTGASNVTFPTSGTLVTESRIINSGTGLTGGGNLSSDRTLSLTGQVLAFHNLSTNGVIARTGSGAVAGRTIAGTSNQVIVVDGDGVSGNPTLSLPQDVHSSATPTFAGATLNGTLGMRANSTASTPTHIPVFVADPASTTRTIVTRTLTEFRSDIGAGTGNGTVTSIETNNGVTGGTITTTGTIGLTGQALAFHNLSTTGLIVRTGAAAVASRSISAGTGISVTNGDGISGNPTITNSAPHIATNLSVTAGTTSGPVINSSTGTGVTIPSASNSASGVVTTSTQTFAGAKTFSGSLIIPTK